MENPKKTIPKKISRIKTHIIAEPGAKPQDIFIGILDSNVEAVLVGSGIERESVLLGELSAEEQEYVATLDGATAAEYTANFEKELETNLDSIIQCDTYTIRDENDYERRFK